MDSRSRTPSGTAGSRGLRAWRRFHTLALGLLVGVTALGVGPSRPDSPISLVFVGDVMLGRGVAPVAAVDPSGLFEHVRWILQPSDLALGNLESPLTSRVHQSANPNTLEADPATAALLADAGFDVLSLANNHVGDAGPAGVMDTIEAVAAAGMTTVGAGADAVTAGEPSTIRVNGSRLAVLAYDATRAGLPVGDVPGVVFWDDRTAKQAIESATARSDLVIVSLHGGVEYLPEPDPRMVDLAEKAISWGADIVWGHGAHVVQPLIVTAGTRPTLTATSLGNFIFDQRGGLTGKGAILQVLADRSGLIAYRMGSTTHTDLRVNWVGWELPRGDAVLIDGEWWNLIRQTSPRSDPGGPIEGFEWGEVVATSAGRVTGDDLEMVVSFRHVPGPHPVRDGLTDIQWLDAKGMSAHLGIYRADDMTPIWVAGMVPAPIADLAACDGSVALAYSELDNPEVIATGAAVWRPFGLDAAERLPGTGTPVCSDIDGDGSTEPVILDRGTANP